MINDVKHLFMCLFAIHNFLVKLLFQSFSHSLNWVVCFLSIEFWDRQTYTHIYLLYTYTFYIYICIWILMSSCQLVNSSEQGSSLRKEHIIICKSTASGWDTSAWWILPKHFIVVKTSPHVSLAHLETMLHRVKHFLTLRLWINLILFKELCIHSIRYTNCNRSTFKVFLENENLVVSPREAFASKLLAICLEYQFNISSGLSSQIILSNK